MILQSLQLRDFRSYAQGTFSFSPESNILYGENGIGKTNLLEAVLLLTGARSWRAGRKSELVRWDCDRAFISGTVFSREREKTIRMELPAGGRTRTEINGVRVKRQYDLSDSFRCVLFSPENLSLVKGPASQRRDLIDNGLCQMRPRYGEILGRYEKLLEQKSRLLKAEDGQPRAKELLPDYNLQLARYGAALVSYRARFCRGLGEECRRMHREISGGKETLDISYQTVHTVQNPFAEESRIADWLLEHLSALESAELQSGLCLSGVHKDDLLLSINGREARAFASQGQTRSAALSLKFGLRELLYRDFGEYPVLLLDDVLSELDGARQAFVAQHAMGGQSIITCCEGKNAFGGANVIEIQ